MSQKERIQSYVDQRHEHYKELALAIHAKPEVSNYEFFACQTLSDVLREEGFEVKIDVAGHRTGFTAVYKSDKPGPVVVFLAEYDALAGIGHACGHNLFGTTSSLAGAALKQVIDEVGGEVRVYGTPGEEGGENGSAKGSFVREGFFDDVDIALCAHPHYMHGPSGRSLANDPVDIEFFGRASHAAANPEHGINALDAVISVFNGINALREHLRDDVRIHGIITHGGEAPNVVPEYAKARFYLRAKSRPILNDVYQKVENIVKGAALQTGCSYKFGLFQNAVDNMVITPSFDAVYEKNLASCGEHFAFKSNTEKVGMGSTDVGNVAQVVPTIQPYIKISDHEMAGHSIEFKEASKSPLGLSSIALGAKVLAQSALDIINQPELLESIKQEHKKEVSIQND